MKPSPDDPARSLWKMLESVRTVMQVLYPTLHADTLQVTFKEGVEFKMPMPACSTPRHSTDFRSVQWFGVEYWFSPTQAKMVSVLWAAWENQTPDVAGETLLEESGSTASRVYDVFKGHSSWGEMVAAGETKGSVRLLEPS